MPASVFEESIYSLVPKANVAVSEKQPLYKSVYAGQARKEFKATQVKKAATMGPLSVPKEDPHHFLHAHEKDPLRKLPKKEHQKKEKHRLPLWQPTKPVVEPKRVPEYPKKTAKQQWELDSYRAKSDYGKVPEYLKERKQKEKQFEAIQNQLSEEQKQKGADGLRRLSEEERQDILAGLKKNWNELMVEYQKLPLVIDTTPKIHRKLKLEGFLKQIEADIEKFSADVIYVQV